MESERNEDLGPRNEDIEEKIKQMLDPSIPDVPNLDDVPVSDPDEKPEKVVVIKSSSSAAKNIKVSDTPSAPELPGSETAPVAESPKPKVLPPSAKTSKKVIIPISHDGPNATTEPTNPVPQLVKNPPKAASKITIQDHSEDPNAVAEKLNEAIAELDPNDTAPMSEEPADTAPEISTEEAEQLNELSKEDTAPTPELPPADDTEEIEIKDPEVIVDPKTDKAVAEIIANEGDEILEIEDAARGTAEPKVKPKKERKSLGKAFAGIFKKRAVRWALILLILCAAAVVAIIPTTRYLALNAAGVRVTSSLTVVDDSTTQPLKNAEVRIGDATGTTDENGNVTLNKVRLGSSELTITKRAFAPVTKRVVMGWGSNPLGGIGLTPTGTQYKFIVTDFLSGKPLARATASTAQSDAVSDEKGSLKLTIEKPSDAEFSVDIKLDGYRTEKVTINPDDTSEHTVKLVPARKHVYISKRTGKFDIYSSYIDGKDEALVLAGSGNERDDMVLIPHPKDNVAAYVSTRAGQRSSNGEILSNLLIINLDDNETTNVGSSEQIKIVSWAADRLIYVQIAPGTNAQSADRYRLMSYDYKNTASKELAKSNFFNDVVGIGNTIYYAPSSAYQTGETNFYRINADGTNNDKLYDKEVWNIIRTAYDQLALSVQQEWFSIRTGDKQPTKLNAAPADQNSRVYIDSPDGMHSAWVDSRDGKGVVLVYDPATKNEQTIKTDGGIGYPLRWLNNSVIVYRVKNAQETADYAISINGGEAVKINDVTNSLGLTSLLY